MARIIGGIGTSHVPTIAMAFDKGKQQDPDWKPLFKGYEPVAKWLAEKKPDVLFFCFNDHATTFLFDLYPTFALGVSDQYRIADEGAGVRKIPPLKGHAALSRHIARSLVADEFDLTMCMEMEVDHGVISPLPMVDFAEGEGGGKRRPPCRGGMMTSRSTVLALLFLATGAAIAWRHLANRRRALRRAGWPMLVGLVLVATSLVDVSQSVRGLLATAFAVGLVLAVMTRTTPSLDRFLSLAPMTWLGRISYGTYLWHWPVLLLVTAGIEASPWVYALVTAAVATGLAALSYELLEHPVRSSAYLSRFHGPTVLVGLTCSVLAAYTVMPGVLRSDVRPSQILTRKSIENAIASVAATGGSTNAVIHLTAIARRIGVELGLEDFERAGRGVHTLVNLMPSGKYLMEDFYYAGGMRALLARIAPHLKLNALTVNGKTLGENIAGASVFDDDVIRPLSQPIYAEGALAVLRGNLAPDGVVIKPSAWRAINSTKASCITWRSSRNSFPSMPASRPRWGAGFAPLLDDPFRSTRWRKTTTA